MGGRRLSSLLLGLLSLLSGALPTGEAQGLLLLPSDSPVTISHPFPVSPVDLGVSSGVSVPADVTGLDTVSAQSSSPSSSTVIVTESDDSGSDVTTAVNDVTGANNETTSNPSNVSTVTGSSEATSADATEPHPPTQTSPAEDKSNDPVTETPSLLATLRLTTTASDDSTLDTTTAMLFHSTLMTVVTSLSSTQSTATEHSTRAAVQRGPSVLEVGHEKDLTSYHPTGSSNPLFVMIVSVFTIMVVMLVVVVGFHRYKKRNSRTEFRRLQDLPMDDMMEDTPLSLYSY